MVANPSETTIRDATEADLPRLVELLAQLSLDTPRDDVGPPLVEAYREAFRRIEDDPRQRLLVVAAAERVVGTAALVIVPNLSHHGRPYAVIESVVVDAAERSLGYGALLMQYLVAEARQAGCHKVTLTSNKLRPDAHRFYRRLSFVATHEGFRIDF